MLYRIWRRDDSLTLGEGGIGLPGHRIFGAGMADNVTLGPLNTANTQRTSSDKSLAIKQVEQAFEAASQRAKDISIDSGVEVLISGRPQASVDPTYEKLGAASRRNG